MQSPLRKLSIWKPTSASIERQPLSNKTKRRFVASQGKAKLPSGDYHILKKTVLLTSIADNIPKDYRKEKNVFRPEIILNTSA